MNILTVDFETYYDKEFSLSKMTTEEYIRHDRFEVIGLAVAVNDSAPEWFSGTHKEVADWLAKFDWASSFVLAHNTQFDGAILSWLFGIKPKGWLDTLCMARAKHGVEAGGSLKALAERYQLGVKGNEVVNALGKRRVDFSVEELGRYSDYCINDCSLTYSLFNRLCDGFPSRELRVIDLTLRMFIEPTLELDLPLLEAHLESVKEKKAALLAAAAADRDSLMSNEKFALLLSTLGIDPPRKISARTQKETWAFAKTDEEFKALLTHPDPRVQTLVGARLGTKTTLEETRTQRFIDIALRGKLPVPLKYYGAKTGRWAADGQINMQNLPRSSGLKQTLRAPDGYVVVGADLSNIELRVGLWLANQMDKLDLLGSGHDLYKDFAASVFGVAYDEVSKEQRFVGKTSQLSLIYGVGSLKLQTAIKAGIGKDIGQDTANSIVKLYRDTYTGVVDAWRIGSNVLQSIHQNKFMTYCKDGFFEVCGAEGIRLPSSLYMRYPGLSTAYENNKLSWSYKTRKGMERIYGAKVFQGLTQATARCIMAEHMVLLAKRYKLVLTVHDAVYMLVKEPEADTALQFTLDTMRTAPAWIPGIPLDAEAGYGKTLADC